MKGSKSKQNAGKSKKGKERNGVDDRRDQRTRREQTGSVESDAQPFPKRVPRLLTSFTDECETGLLVCIINL